MAEKQIVTVVAALRRTKEPGSAPPETETQKRRWKFVKLFGVADVIKFEDGTTYRFRAIKRNDGGGLSSTAQLDTDDENLAQKLRQASKDPVLGLVEVKI